MKIIIYVLYPLTFFCGFVLTQTCQKVDSCRCTYSDSHIDLTPIVNSVSPPRFKDMYDQYYNKRFSYNPCFSFTENSCNNVAVCMIDYSTYRSIGTQDTASFNTSQNDVSIIYQSKDGRTSRVRLVCSNDVTSLEVYGESPTNVYNFVLKSPYCCTVSGSLFIDTVSMSVGIKLIIGYSAFFVFIISLGLLMYLCGPRNSQVQAGQVNQRHIDSNAYVPLNRIATPPPYSRG
ncbi:hypothetical protein Btru_061616 [Bulinus truncatus]|nr:hypothetical protein Btru_061616 [Bulinus truncatus]